MWDEWGRMTRYMESARIALLREKNLWNSLELQDSKNAKVHVVNGAFEYQVSLDEHHSAISDEWLFCAQILVYSYALAEGAASDKLGCNAAEIGGVEAWGKRLLDASGNAWNDVLTELAGIIEVSIIRNAISHGQREYTQSNFDRMRNVGVTPSWVVGDSIALNYELLKEYRNRLKSLLRLGGI